MMTFNDYDCWQFEIMWENHTQVLKEEGPEWRTEDEIRQDMADDRERMSLAVERAFELVYERDHELAHQLWKVANLLHYQAQDLAPAKQVQVRSAPCVYDEDIPF